MVLIRAAPEYYVTLLELKRSLVLGVFIDLEEAFDTSSDTSCHIMYFVLSVHFDKYCKSAIPNFTLHDIALLLRC